MPLHPQLVAFDVTEAIRKQAVAIEKLVDTLAPEDLGAIVEATAELVDAWRRYQQASDPDGWAAALEEMERQGVTADLPFLRGASKASRPAPGRS